MWLSKVRVWECDGGEMCFVNVSADDLYLYCSCFVKNQVKIMAKGMNSDNIKYCV